METVDRDDKPPENNDDLEHYCSRSEPVLAQILTNLPLKPLFSFKSVSKRWNSLISSPFFSKNYIIANKKLLDSSISPPWMLLFRYSKDETLRQDHCTISTILSTESSNDQVTVAVCDFPFPVPSKGRYLIVSSSNGLLLCRLDVGNGLLFTFYYAICNPVTRQWILLPPHRWSGHVIEAFVTKLEPSSLKVIGYKVVLLQYKNEYFMDLEEFVLYIYDSETKIWTEAKLSFSFTCLLGTSVCLNGIIHWIVWMPMTTMPTVVAYDTYKLPNQELRLITHPTITEQYNQIDTLVEAIQGKLHYLANDVAMQVLALWVLEDYHEDEWVLKHRFDFNPTTRTMLRSWTECYMPFAFHPSDSNIIYLLTKEEPKKVMSYDISKESLAPLCVSSPIHYRSEVFPFVLPLWPPIIDC